MDIYWEVLEVTPPDYFCERYKTIKQKKEEKAKRNFQQIYTGYYPRTYTPNTIGNNNPGLPRFPNHPSQNTIFDKSPSNCKVKTPTEKDLLDNGKLLVNGKEYTPLANKEIREKVQFWLKSGIENFLKGVSVKDGSIPGLVANLEAYFNKVQDKQEEEFFINQLQKSMLDVFEGYHVNTVSNVGTEMFDSFEEPLGIQIYNSFDCFPEYVSSMVDIVMEKNNKVNENDTEDERDITDFELHFFEKHGYYPTVHGYGSMSDFQFEDDDKKKSKKNNSQKKISKNLELFSKFEKIPKINMKNGKNTGSTTGRKK